MNCKLCGSPKVSVRYKLSICDLLECRSCGFRFIPYLDASSPAGCEVTAEQIERTERYADNGLEYSKRRQADQVELLRSFVPVGRKVLDVGCGAGAFLRNIAPDYRGVGIEASAVWLAVARKRGIDAHGETMDAPIWQAQRGTFGAVCLWDVIEHVNSPRETCRQAFDMLAAGGCLLLDTPSRDGLLYKFGEATMRLTGWPTTLGAQYSPTPFDHKQIFRKAELRRLLTDAGFRNITIRVKSEISLPVDVYLQAMIRSKPIARALRPLASLATMIPMRNKLVAIAVK